MDHKKLQIQMEDVWKSLEIRGLGLVEMVSIEDPLKESLEQKSATLSSPYRNDLKLALFNLKNRGVIRSHGSIRKSKLGYAVKVNYKTSKKNLQYNVRNFYGYFIKVT